MYRYIYRRAAHFNHTVYIVIGKIRHRYIVTVQKRKSAVIILKIYRLAHTGRILIYKTEHASVTAATLFIHQKRRKFKSDVIVFRLFQRNVKKFSTSVNFERNKLFGYPKTVIENIAYLMSVYGYENIIRGDPSAVGNRTGDYIFYLYRGTHLRHTSAENLNYKIRTRPAGRNRRLRGHAETLLFHHYKQKSGGHAMHAPDFVSFDPVDLELPLLRILLYRNVRDYSASTLMISLPL